MRWCVIIYCHSYLDRKSSDRKIHEVKVSQISITVSNFSIKMSTVDWTELKT